MMKKKFTSVAALGLCLALGFSMGVSADSRKVVTLGADLSEQQKQIVMNYFGVTADQVDILTITNQDERDHLGSYVPLEQIGTHTYSCALVSPTASGGIQVKTANLDWVTCNMIATTLSTSGVVNCDVIAASPIQVSGTGALTGIIMAYEQASGETLSPQKKELATEELVITGQLANNVGQKEATAIVNEAKTEIISQNITDVTVIQNIVNEAANDNNTQLTQDQVDMVTELLDKISQEDYNYDDMKDTLERVDENVGVTSQTDELSGDESNDEESAAQQAAQDAQAEAETETEETEASILDNTNDDAFGGDVITGSTLEPETDAPLPETESPILETEMPAETYTEGSDGIDAQMPAETEMPVETEAPVLETEAPVETEAPAETEVSTEPQYTIDDLSDEKKVTYTEINWYLDRVLDLTTEASRVEAENGEHKEEYKEISEMDVTALAADEETSKALKEEFDQFLLKFLVEGLSEEEKMLDELDTAEYGAPEVKVLSQKIKDLIVTDAAQKLVSVDPTVRQTVSDEAEAFFKKIYGVDNAADEGTYSEEEPGETEAYSEDSYEDEYSDESYSEEGSDKTYDENMIPEATDDGTME
ncbi:MAG: DUF1002 domain-containing protein [Blautia sp.]